MTAPGPSAAAPPTRRRRAAGPVPKLDRERHHWARGAVVAGVDEVGRGAWAGPVTCAAVVLPTDRRLYGLRDSKRLTAPQRRRLDARIRASAVAVGIGQASNEEIDAAGMSAALRLAARRALDALTIRPDVVLLDGNWDFLADYGTRNETIVRGDDHCASIAAASIVAKVDRDAAMTAAAAHHPPYAFDANKGYPSPSHRAALETVGPCDLHRVSWAPIAALAQGRLFDLPDDG